MNQTTQYDRLIKMVKFNWWVFALLGVFAIMFTFAGIIVSERSAEWEKIPYIDREVHANVVIAEYTECIFLVEGERVMTYETPCKYKEGETVITKYNGGKYISIYEERE